MIRQNGEDKNISVITSFSSIVELSFTLFYGLYLQCLVSAMVVDSNSADNDFKWKNADFHMMRLVCNGWRDCEQPENKQEMLSIVSKCEINSILVAVNCEIHGPWCPIVFVILFS